MKKVIWFLFSEVFVKEHHFVVFSAGTCKSEERVKTTILNDLKRPKTI